MGRFEDLIEAAEQGDTSALATLKSEFSGGTLREKAEKVDALEAKLEKGLPLIRKALLIDLQSQLDDDLKGARLSPDDFKDIDPDDLTLDMVKERAKSQIDGAQAAKLTLATESGFATVEEFDAAIASAKAQSEQRVASMEQVAGGVSSSGGEPSGTADTGKDVTREAFEASKKAGKSDDVALAAGIGALLESQMEAQATE